MRTIRTPAPVVLRPYTRPLPRTDLLLSPKVDHPIRISNTAIYGAPIEEEFQRTRRPILKSTISIEGEEINTYSLLDSGCEGYAFIDLEWAREKGIPLYPMKPFSLVGYDGAQSEDRAVSL